MKTIIISLIISNLFTMIFCKNIIDYKKSKIEKLVNVEKNNHIFTQAELMTCVHRLRLLITCNEDDFCETVEDDVYEYLKTKGEIE